MVEIDIEMTVDDVKMVVADDVTIVKEYTFIAAGEEVSQVVVVVR